MTDKGDGPPADDVTGDEAMPEDLAGDDAARDEAAGGEVIADQPPVGGFEETAQRRRRQLVVLAIIAAIALLGVFISAFVPRTVAEADDGSWSITVAPGVLSPTIRAHAGDETVTLDTSGSALADTAVAQAPEDVPTITAVAGATPRDVASVRVTSLERGVGEASIERVAWRRVHVAVLTGDVWVTDLVGISQGGSVVEVVQDLPPPEVSGS